MLFRNKKFQLIAGAVILLSLIGLVIWGISRGNKPVAGGETVSGTVTEVVLNSRVITLKDAHQREISLALLFDTKLFNPAGEEVEISHFQPGMTITANGKFTNDVSMVPTEVRETTDGATPAGGNTYVNSLLKVSLEYPADWQADEQHKDARGNPVRYAGAGGFFAIDAIVGANSTLEELAKKISLQNNTYGAKPTIEKIGLHNQTGRLILPSADQLTNTTDQAALLLTYPKPVVIGDALYRYLAIYADTNHIRDIARSLTLSAEEQADKYTLRITSPATNAVIGLPLVIRGQALVFQNRIAFRLLDANGAVLASGESAAKRGAVGQYGPFEITTSYQTPASQTGELEVSDLAEKNSSINSRVRLPVRFPTVESATIRVYFGNIHQDPNGFRCNQTYPAERRIIKTDNLPFSALEELFRGVSASDLSAGFFSAINREVKVRNLTIINGVAQVDLSEELQKDVIGSCRLSAIRSQITNTLTQFPQVRNVIISINGRSEDVLQP